MRILKFESLVNSVSRKTGIDWESAFAKFESLVNSVSRKTGE